MPQKELTLNFDLDDPQDRQVYEALTKLPGFFQVDQSKALVMFISTILSSLAECEERKTRCEDILKAVLGTVPKGKKIWN